MLKLSISEFSTYRWTLDQEVKEFSDRQIHGIGLWRTKLSDLSQDLASDLLYEHEISVSSLSWAGGFTGSFGLSFEESIDDACAAIRLAARMGCPCLIIHPGSRNGHTDRHATRLLKGGLKRLMPVAADFGVRLALEPMDPEQFPDWTMVDSLTDILDLVKDIKSPDLGIVLDLFHTGYQSQWLERLHEIAPYIALVQLADRDLPETETQHQERCLIGRGSVPVQQWYDALEAVGYRGFCEIELHGSHVSQLSYQQILHHAVVTWSRLKDRASTRLEKPGLTESL